MPLIHRLGEQEAKTENREVSDRVGVDVGPILMT